MNDIERIREVRANKMCCAQTLVRLGLDWRGEENEQLMQAVAGLCGGLKCGLTCGALTGAVCMLGLFDQTDDDDVRALVEQFNQAYGVGGSVACDDILQGHQDNKKAICDSLIEGTYRIAKNILIKKGLQPGGILAQE